jgi:hypothetical protein
MQTNACSKLDLIDGMILESGVVLRDQFRSQILTHFASPAQVFFSFPSSMV